MADALAAVQAEVESEDEAHVFTLTTELGEAEITVPPIGKWRSSARFALIKQGDDYSWAQSTLSDEDFAEWVRCDPDTDESGVFFAEVMKANGVTAPKSGPSKTSSRSTRRK